MLLLTKNLIFTILVPGTIAVYVPILILPHPDAEVSFSAVVGVLLLVVGASIYVWCLCDFAREGRGTPAPMDPPRRLVIRGLYRVMRNPMYLGVLVSIAGWALLFHSGAIAIYGLSVATSFHLFVLLYEEPHLRKVFGSRYEQYCHRVRRWIPF